MAHTLMPLGSFTATSPVEERRFLRITAVTLALFAFFAAVIPLIPIPELSEEPPRPLPPRLARLQLERETPKPPEPQPRDEPDEQVAPEPPAEPEPAPAQPAPEPEPTPAEEPVPPRETAREEAARSGLLAFQDELADLRERAPTQALNQQSLTEGGETAALPKADTERLVGGAQQTSGGIQSAQGPTTQQALGGRDTTRVTRPDGPGGGAGGRRERDTGGRSLASIQAVFDRNKGALYTLYNRALRRDPSLEGRVVIKLTIAPSGKVTDIRLVSSGLANDPLVRRIIDRIRLFEFGEADVKATTLEYPLDFMPS